MLLIVITLNHKPELQAQNSATSPPDPPSIKTRNVSSLASTYVPLDSWVYPALERLEALGLVQTGFLGLRPWTRMECTRLVVEADELSGGELPSEAKSLYRDLKTEFAPELERIDGRKSSAAQIESVYSRFTGIAVEPVNDSYHFAQSLTNNLGRPYGRGGNWYEGGAARAAAVRLLFMLAVNTRTQRVASPFPRRPNKPSRRLISRLKRRIHRPQALRNFSCSIPMCPGISRITSCPSESSRYGGDRVPVGRYYSATTPPHLRCCAMTGCVR